MALELAFVLAPRQNLFFVELVEALRAEVEGLGVDASIHVGNFPTPKPERVYVMVPPHEYFTILDGRHGPLPEVLKQRTIFICGEQPDTPFFDSNVALAPRGGAVFDINRYGVRAFAREGVEATHLQLGWTRSWDHFSYREPIGRRDIDILFMGSLTDRRARALGSYARAFSRYRCELLLSDNSMPNWKQSGSFRADDEKWKLLGRSKVLLNLHQDEMPYFEWLRIVQGISNGAVVVSEDSIDYGPLVPGEHLLMGDVGSLDLLAELVLQDPTLRRQIQRDAYEKLRRDLPLSASVTSLIATAAALAETEPIHETTHRFFTQPQPDPDELPFFDRPEPQPAAISNGDENAAWMRRALKDLRLELLDMRREQAATELEATRGGRLPSLELVARSPTYDGAAPRVSVLTALYNHGALIGEALSSVAASWDCALELIVVDDGSTDGSAQAVIDWMGDHQDVPTLLLRHPVNRGLASARNDALSLARGEFCFVLDADNEVYPHCLRRLSDTLDRHQSASLAYGMLESFSGNECLGLINTLPWEPRRLRVGNYIDAMAMFRTRAVRALGGYPTDRRLHGWEDYALWCAMASAAHHGIRVPEILARYRVARHSMLSLTNISSTDAFSVIIAANPVLMAGVQAPD